MNPVPRYGCPFEPETMSYILPPSTKDIVATSLLLSVNSSESLPFVSFRLREPGNNFSLYLALSALITYISSDS